VLDAAPISSLSGIERIGVNFFGLVGANPLSRTISPDGTFTLNLPAAEYRISLTNLPANVYVKSARVGNTEVPLQSFTIGVTPPENFEIAISPTAGEISGTLQDRNGEPAGLSTVVLVPENRERRSCTKVALPTSPGSSGSRESLLETTNYLPEKISNPFLISIRRS
jgi:hypothetical protein